MKKINLILILIPTLLYISCQKEKNTIDGPPLEELYGEFTIKDSLAVSRDTVDFSIGENVYFTTELSKTIEWKITITGQTTGAKKILTGTNKLLTANQIIWDGSTTEFPVFGIENCEVQMTFAGQADTVVRNIYVKGQKLNPGYLITDFESGFSTGWTTFVQGGANMDFQIKSDATSPEGGSYFNMAGTVDWDYLIGYLYLKASANGVVTYPLDANPDNEYFNVLIYGEPSITNAIVLFQFQEDENANGSFSPTTEDQYDYQLNVDWVGWKLVSVKYSDLVTLVNGAPGTPKGNQQHNPDKLRQINVLHLANPATGYSKCKMDYMIFTKNKPLNP